MIMHVSYANMHNMDCRSYKLRARRNKTVMTNISYIYVQKHNCTIKIHLAYTASLTAGQALTSCMSESFCD